MAEPRPTDDLAALCAAAAGGAGGAGGEAAIHATERLLWLHHARLMGLANRKIGPDWQGKIEPEDLLQDTYTAIFTTISKFEHRGEDSFFHWAAKILDQRFIDRVRTLRRKKRDVGREVQGEGAGAGASGQSRHLTLLDRLAALDPSPSHFARRADAVAAMMACIARLPDDYRAVIQRIHLGEEPWSTVAHDLGRTEDALRRLGGRALEKLNECMGRASRYMSAGGL